MKKEEYHILFMTGFSGQVLTSQLSKIQGDHSQLRQSLGSNLKGKISLILYVLAILCAYWQPMVSFSIYCAIALFWIIPDRRIERNFDPSSQNS